MYCPRCGERQTLGARRCGNCGTPFTRREAARGEPAPRRRTAPPATRPGGNRAYHRTNGAGRKVLSWLLVATIAVILVSVLVSTLTSNVVQPYVGRVVEPGAGENIGDEMRSGIEAADVGTVPIEGDGQVVITEEQLNGAIAERVGRIGPLDRIRVEIQSDELTIHTSAYGLDGRYHGRVAAEDGRITVRDGRTSGVLGWLIPVEQLEATLNREINAALAQSGVTVESVALEPGRMIVGIQS